jgi:hypothetical protein
MEMEMEMEMDARPFASSTRKLTERVGRGRALQS